MGLTANIGSLQRTTRSSRPKNPFRTKSGLSYTFRCKEPLIRNETAVTPWI